MNSSIWLINGTIIWTTTLGQSGLESTSNEWVPHILQSYRSEPSLSDGFMSYPRHWVGLISLQTYNRHILQPKLTGLIFTWLLSLKRTLLHELMYPRQRLNYPNLRNQLFTLCSNWCSIVILLAIQHDHLNDHCQTQCYIILNESLYKQPLTHILYTIAI